MQKRITFTGGRGGEQPAEWGFPICFVEWVVEADRRGVSV